VTPKHARQRNTVATIVAAALAWTSIPSAGHQGGAVQPPGWGVRFADTVIARWPDPATIDPAKNGWEYNTGIVLFGMAKMYDATKDPRYLDYIKRWVDGYVNEQGVLGWDQSRTHNLDYIQPGMLVLFLHERTGDPRYKAAAKTVREAFDRIPKNADGGFWHKSQYPNEMWIDGIYMGQPFLVNYGRLFDDAAFGNDMAVFQSTLAAQHCLDPKTGLLYHAWDQDRNATWADPKTGRSPIIWGRGMGWFVMAMVDILEQLPPSHPGYPRLHALLKGNVAGLAAAQDPKSGLWFQVLDRGASLPGNWIETSSSGMFIYAIRKGIRLGLVDAKYGPVTDRAWKGLQATFEQDAAGRPVFTGAVQGMGVQTDAAGYLKIPRLRNSTHGLMAVMIAASEMERLLKMQGEGGLWRQLLDHPEAWPETSGTGMFAFAMVTGVQNGWLDEGTYGPAARKAWLGLLKYIGDAGNISNVCAGTNKSTTIQYYLDRPRNTGDLHGQAPVLWTASALLR
jgi:unsaturated rhamnogalacturonyl hydrolase